jgi:hypothetical protein
VRASCALAFVLGAIAACGGHPAPATKAQPTTTLDSQVTARSTTPPKLAWSDGAFAVEGLPAVARGGEVAVVAFRDNDSGRGFKNLRIEARDRTDKVVQTIPVMTVDEYQTLVPDGKTASAELAHRLEVANHELAKLHGLHDLVAMHPLELQPSKDLPHLAIGDELDVDFDVDHVHVFHHNDERPFITLTATSWLANPRKTCEGCPPCTNPVLLANAYHVPLITVLVLDIGYHGTDTCWEPPDQWHVIAW